MKGLHAVHFHVDGVHFEVVVRRFLLEAGEAGARVGYDLPLDAAERLERQAAAVGLAPGRDVGPLRFSTDPDALRQQAAEGVHRSLLDGYRGLWLVQWGGGWQVGEGDWLRVEHTWTELSRQLPLVVLCAYAAFHGEPEIRRTALRGHPYYYIGGQFLAEAW